MSKKKSREEFPSKFKGPSQSPGFLLWQVTNLWQRKQREALAPLGLTHVQFVLLAVTFYLETEGQKVTQNALALKACTDRMMTSQVVRKLEEKGWIKRISDPSDGRAILLSMTGEGKAMIKKAMPVVEEVDHQFFHKLDDKQNQLCQFLVLLK